MTLPSDLARELATGSHSQPPASLPVTPARHLSSQDSVAHPTELARLSTSTTSLHEQDHPPEDNVYSTHPPSSGAARPLLELDEHG